MRMISASLTGYRPSLVSKRTLRPRKLAMFAPLGAPVETPVEIGPDMAVLREEARPEYSVSLKPLFASADLRKTAVRYFAFNPYARVILKIPVAANILETSI